ncbi:hypothetical protein BAC3_02409 [uncultured bacterium]|nr:hypothetical protein BAC3_02409 [uncultured bacterium]
MERNYLLDNAKIILMFLVVFGHELELTSNSLLLQTLYLFIYSFHIPMFVLISGMLSKAELSSKDIQKNIVSLLIPLLVLTVFYEAVEYIRYGEFSHYTKNLQPYWLLWFLLSLFFWKLLLPIIQCFKYPVLLSILIGILAGYVEQTGYYLSLSRTFTFLPFFILGYQLKPAFFLRLQTYHKALFIIVLILAITVFSYFHDIPSRWFYGSLSYTALNMNEWTAGFIRLGIYGVSFIIGCSVIALLPNRTLKITVYGERSLYIYIWHGFFIKLIGALGFITWLNNKNDIATLFALLLLAALITFMLASEKLASMTNKLLFTPIKNHLLRAVNS